MKKRSLGKQLLFAGSILTVAFACQSKTSNAPAANPSTNQNPMQNDNEDEDMDDGAYGDGDTSTSNDQDLSTPAIKIESATDVADIKQTEKSGEVPVVSSEEVKTDVTAVMEEIPATEAVLEAVSPVEIIAEHQLQQTDQN